MAGAYDFLENKDQQDLKDFDRKIRLEESKLRPNKKVLENLRTHRERIARRIHGKPSKSLIELFGNPEESGVRSNKTNKPRGRFHPKQLYGSEGKLAKRALEKAPSRAAVIGPGEMIGRGIGAHARAIENMVLSKYGPDYTAQQLDDTIDSYYKGRNFERRMGFSSARTGFISREQAQALWHLENPELSESELHAGRVQQEQTQRAKMIGEEAAVGEARRGRGEEGERVLRKRKAVQSMERHINQELGDLTRRSEFQREGNVRKFLKERSPTGRFSPYEVREGLDAGDKEVVAQRIRDLLRRRTTIREQKGLLGPGNVDPKKVYGKLANLARGIGTKGAKAVGPLGFLVTPGETIQAAKDLLSGDEDRIMKAVEHFQGLPERSTGRRLTEREKLEMTEQGIPWYEEGEGGYM